MSLTAFKRKSVIKHGSKRSGTAPGGYWLPQGPFGHATEPLQSAIQNYGSAGFSLNGGHRNVGGVGREMKMSKSGTPYRGTQPIGWGGTYGKYNSAQLTGPYSGAVPNTGSHQIVQPVLNSSRVNTLGTQYQYIKPSVLSTYGMLDKKYKWIHYGTYPNYWVQPNYTGNQTQTSGQLLYIQKLSSKNSGNLKVNNVGDYENYIIPKGPTLCKPGTSTATFKYNDMARNAPYTKTLYQPVSYDKYNMHLTRACINPLGTQKPFPYATSTGSSISPRGTTITSFGNACNTSNTVTSPPEWYTTIKTGTNTNTNTNTNTITNCNSKTKTNPQTGPFPMSH